MEKKEFQFVFVVAKGKLFEINYRTLATNAEPYFATSAAQFNKPRTDFNRCGQCQYDILWGEATKAYDFYKKWNKLHLKDLNDEQYTQIVNDIEKLKSTYPFYFNTDGHEIAFGEEVAIERAYRGLK